MFKKTEESEWTRFSRALGGKDQPREQDEMSDADDELETAADDFLGEGVKERTKGRVTGGERTQRLEHC